MEFIIGFTGAIVAVLLLVLGVILGWRAKERDYERTKAVTAEELSEKQKQRLREEREAWNTLFDYNAETAYGGEVSTHKHKRSDAE